MAGATRTDHVHQRSLDVFLLPPQPPPPLLPTLVLKRKFRSHLYVYLCNLVIIKCWIKSISQFGETQFIITLRKKLTKIINANGFHYVFSELVCTTCNQNERNVKKFPRRKCAAEEYTGGGSTHAHLGGGNMAAITSLYGLFWWRDVVKSTLSTMCSKGISGFLPPFSLFKVNVIHGPRTILSFMATNADEHDCFSTRYGVELPLQIGSLLSLLLVNLLLNTRVGRDSHTLQAGFMGEGEGSLSHLFFSPFYTLLYFNSTRILLRRT